MKFDQSEIDAIAEAVAAKLSEPPRMYTVEQAAERLSLPVRWLYERTASGVIPCHRHGKYVRFDDKDLRLIIASG